MWLKKSEPTRLLLTPLQIAPENAGNRISEGLKLKIFRGSMHPHPPRGYRLWRAFIRTPLHQILHPPQYFKWNRNLTTKVLHSYCVMINTNICNYLSKSFALSSVFFLNSLNVVPRAINLSMPSKHDSSFAAAVCLAEAK